MGVTEFYRRTVADTGSPGPDKHTPEPPSDTVFFSRSELTVASPGRARDEIDAHLAGAPKHNYISAEVAERAALLHAARERYDSMPSALAARDLVERVIARIAPDPALHSMIDRFLKAAEGYYPNTDQYHNAEHALTVTAYHLGILAGARRLDDGRDVMRGVLRAMFHDTGNARTPEIRVELKGEDELNAATTLLSETNRASFSNTIAEDSSALLFTSGGGNRLRGAERLHDASCVLGTVFADRFCSAAAFSRESYVTRFADMLRANHAHFGISKDDLAEFGTRFGEPDTSSPQALERAIAAAMVSPEACALRHADISGSMTLSEACKSSCLNRKEDDAKPWVHGRADPLSYLKDFGGFVAGRMHARAHADDLESPAYLAALQLQYQAVVPEALRSPRDAFAAGALAAALQNGAVPTADAERVARFTLEHGWNPTIFHGLSSAVNTFGTQKLAKLDQFAAELSGPGGALIRAAHALIAADPNLDFGAEKLGNLVPAVIAKAGEFGIDQPAESARILGTIGSGVDRISFASLTGRKVSELFMPDLAIKLPLNEKLTEIGWLLAAATERDAKT